MLNRSNIATFLMVSTLAFPAFSKVTLEDAYKDNAQRRAYDLSENAKYMSRHSSPILPQYGGGASSKIVRVWGNDAGRGQSSLATCPTGYSIMGGGYILVRYGGGNGFNAPDQSIPEPNYNRWRVVTPNADRVFKAVATCISL